MIKTGSVLIIILLLFNNCSFLEVDKMEGRFGHSETKEEAVANGSAVIRFIPNTCSFLLLDGTTLFIDTAWTEQSFTYQNGKRIFDTNYGYHFSIPFIKKVPDSFTFAFSLADKSNQASTNGVGETLVQICPKVLYKEMKVLLEQKDPDTSKGWTHTIILDTITFRQLN